MSPTIYREGPFRFFFYSNENSEPAHVHVEAGDGEAKVWLKGAEVESFHGLTQKQMKQVVDIVKARQAQFQEAWDDYFDGE
jgi:hypothetical protein